MTSLIERPLRDVANEGNPNKVGSVAQFAKLGDFFAGGLRYYRGAVSSHVLTLPDAAKAHVLIGGFIIAGTGGVGPIQVDPDDGTLASGEAKVNPNGNIGFFATDAVTEAEVYYLALEAEPVTMDVIVDPATGVCSLAPYAAVRLVGSTILAGGVTGASPIQIRGTLQGALATTQCALQADGETVEFDIGDSITSARLTFIPQPGYGPTPVSVARKMENDVNF